jgi:propanol-preferring alcohol dehydrogenase
MDVPKTMNCGKLYGAHQKLRFEQVPVPVPKGNQVLLKITGASMCHSDVGTLNGLLTSFVQIPRIIGHENCGIVAAIGEDVTKWKVGDPVAVWGSIACGCCRECNDGDAHLCNYYPRGTSMLGASMDGGYAEYMLVPDDGQLISLGDLDPVNAGPLSDAGLTAYRAVKKAVKVMNPCDYILITGIGGLGGFAVNIAKLLAPSCYVIASSRKPEARQMALERGADFIVDGTGDVFAQVMEITGGLGCRAAIDLAGTKQTLQTSFDCLNTKGLLVIVGITGEGLDYHHNNDEKTVTCSYWGSFNEFGELLDLAKSGKLIVPECKKVPLKKANVVLKMMERGEFLGRSVIIPDMAEDDPEAAWIPNTSEEELEF